jgi:CPA1 family monovalent cation:H+ antiporter
MSYVELSGRALATTRLQRAAVWDTVQFALNGIVFVLLGEQLPGILSGAITSVEQSGHLNPWWLVVYALAINFGLAALRFIWVWTSLRLTLFRARQRGETAPRLHWRLVLATSLAGVRGTITLAGVMTLPLLLPDGSPFPARELTIFLASAVILLSLVVASVGLPRVLRGLTVPEEDAEQLAEDRARHDAATAAIAAIEKSQYLQEHDAADADIYSQAATRVIALYQRRLVDGVAGDREAGQLRKADTAERLLRLAGLDAERKTVFKLARNAGLSDEISRKLVREIDLIESRYR